MYRALIHRSRQQQELERQHQEREKELRAREEKEQRRRLSEVEVEAMGDRISAELGSKSPFKVPPVVRLRYHPKHG